MLLHDIPPVAQIRAGFAQWSARLPRLGIREGALRLGVPEGHLAGALCGLNEEIGIVSCSRLDGPVGRMIGELVAAGGLLATFGDRRASGAVLVHDASCDGDAEDLRLRAGPLRLGLPRSEPLALIAVREARGCRCGTLESIGLYGRGGRPVLRLHRTGASDAQAFASAVSSRTIAGTPRFAAAERGAPAARLLAPSDVQRLSAGWREAPDRSASDALLARVAASAGTDRLRLLDALAAADCRPIAPAALGSVLAALCAPGNGGFEARCADGGILSLPAGARHACAGREHLMVVEDLCLRLAHDAIAHVRAPRLPGSGGPCMSIEVYDAERRRMLTLRAVSESVVPAWSPLVDGIR